MRIRRGPDIPKKVGEYLLDTIAAGQPVQALHLALNGIAGERSIGETIEALEQFLSTSDRMPRLTAFCMPAGDLFLFTGAFTSEALRQLTSFIAMHLSPPVAPDEVKGICHIYDVPDDAIPLRRLVKTFLDLPEVADRARPAAATAAVAMPGAGPGPASPAAAAFPPARAAPAAPPARRPSPPPRPAAEPEGPLTLAVVEQLHALVQAVDLAPFIHQQKVYARGRVFAANYTEYQVDLERLRRTCFPTVEFAANDSLRVELTGSLDALMLGHLLRERMAGHEPIGLNLSLATIHAPAFEGFSRQLSLRERGTTIVELHWLEVLRDIEDGGQAVRALTGNGYRVAVDHIGIAALPYLDLGAFAFDFLKVRFDRAALTELGAKAVAALRQAPADRIVLIECDDRRALALGEALGITHYQGALIDQLAAAA